MLILVLLVIIILVLPVMILILMMKAIPFNQFTMPIANVLYLAGDDVAEDDDDDDPIKQIDNNECSLGGWVADYDDSFKQIANNG